MHCPACDRESPSDARICSACGKPLEAAEAPPKPAPADASWRELARRLASVGLFFGGTELVEP